MENLIKHFKPIDSNGNITNVIEFPTRCDIENVYKTYIIRVKRERAFTKLLQENNIHCNYEVSLQEVNKRIEFLYKKYATEII